MGMFVGGVFVGALIAILVIALINTNREENEDEYRR